MRSSSCPFFSLIEARGAPSALLTREVRGECSGVTKLRKGGGKPMTSLARATLCACLRSRAERAAPARRRISCLTRPALRLAAKGMGGVDAEDARFAGEELELLERAGERRVVRVSVHVGEELGGGELAALHVALELGHVDAVGGEAAKRLVERGGHVTDAKDEGRHHRPIARRRPAFIPRQHHEPGGV